VDQTLPALSAFRDSVIIVRRDGVSGGHPKDRPASIMQVRPWGRAVAV